MPDLVQLENGGYVTPDHPLYLEEQKRKQSTQTPTSLQPNPKRPGDPADIYVDGKQPYKETTVQVADDFGGPHNPDGTPTQGAPAPTNTGGVTLPPGAQFMEGANPNDPNALVRMPDGSLLPVSHPMFKTAGGSPAPTTGTPGAPGGQPTSYTPPNQTPGQSDIDTQAKNAQTYSTTPGSAPTQNTMNQGTQDVYRNSLLQRATQGTKVDMNDPALRQQSDAFRAQAVRAARELQADQAVAAGPTGSQFARGQQRATGERAAQAVGSFEAQLVGRELQNRRDEIQQALSALGANIENDQRRALEKQLAELNAAIQRHGIDTGAATADKELALKDKLGMGGLNVDLMRSLLQNQQFGNELGLNIADREAYWNNAALQSLF